MGEASISSSRTVLLLHQFSVGVSGVSVMLAELAPVLTQVDPSLRIVTVGFDQCSDREALKRVLTDGETNVVGAVAVNLHIEAGWDLSLEVFEHCRRDMIPTWLYAHDYWPRHRDNVALLTGRYAATLLASTAHVAEQLAGDGFEPKLVPAGVPLAHVVAARCTQTGGTPVVGSCGRLVPRKRFGDIVEAFGHLSGDRCARLHLRLLPSLVFPAADDERLLDGLHETLRRTCVEPSRVRLEDHATAAVDYNDLTVYVAASDYEGFGMTPIEASFALCPPLLSDIPAHRSIAEKLFPDAPEDVLFPVGDIQVLAARARDELDTGRRRASLVGRRDEVHELIERHWSLRQTAVDLARVIAVGGA